MAQAERARGGRVASPAMIWALSSSSSAAILLRMAASAARSLSIKIAAAAPRDKASRPSARVPAKASRTLSSANGRPLAANSPCERMLNSASRARSLVGRTASPGGATSRRPRCLPPTIRTGFSPVFGWAAPACRHGLASGLAFIVAFAELVRQDRFRHLLDVAAGEVAELERAIAEADQPRHRVAQILQDLAHL